MDRTNCSGKVSRGPGCAPVTELSHACPALVMRAAVADRIEASWYRSDAGRPEVAPGPSRTRGHRPATAFRCAGLAAILALAVDVSFAQPSEPPPPCSAAISVASPSTPVTFYPDPDGKKGLVGHIYVRNDGATPLSEGSATIYLFDLNGRSLGSQSNAYSHLKAPPGAVQDLLLSLDVRDADLPVSGLVVVGADAANCQVSAKQAVQSFVIPSRASARNASWIVLLSAVAALVVFVIAVLVFWGGLTKPMGASEWSFSASAATNLTVAGTLLTGVLASSAVPEYPHYLTKQGYWVLSLLFGILASLAPVLYNFCCKPTQPDSANPQSLDFQGSVWLFLLSAVVTVWAVFGQLATLSVMFREFAKRQVISDGSAWGECVVAVGVGVSLLVYCFRCARYYIKEHPARQPAEEAVISARDLAEVTRRAVPRWTAF